MIPWQIPFAVHGIGHIAEDNEEAADNIYPSFMETMTRIGKERGWPPMTREQFVWLEQVTQASHASTFLYGSGKSQEIL